MMRAPIRQRQRRRAVASGSDLIEVHWVLAMAPFLDSTMFAPFSDFVGGATDAAGRAATNQKHSRRDGAAAFGVASSRSPCLPV